MAARCFKLVLSLLVPALVAILAAPIHVAAASALPMPMPMLAGGASSLSPLIKRGGHRHHHGAPLLQINETEITMYHAPTPPSYWSIDVDALDSSGPRHPRLMLLHAILMSAAFFVALPMSIAMRSVKSSWHGFLVLLFYSLCALGCAASALYTKLTPNMYQGAKHSFHGYLVLLVSLSLSSLDVIRFGTRLISFIRSRDKLALRPFWSLVILGREVPHDISGPEYSGLVVDEPEEYESLELKSPQPVEPSSTDPFAQQDNPQEHQTAAQWANDVHQHNRHKHSLSASSARTLFDIRTPPLSRNSDDTLHDVAQIHKTPLFHRIGKIAHATAERALVFAGFGQLLTGIVVYTGGCRENYINGCLAHLIKGGIFWSYGLISFARFLGSFSEYGWAWNRAPAGDYPTAEFVESAVIFFYGITNTWMERFGANPGDPYTTKQVQHIGIAVMFWFAGVLGMCIESKRIRRWLGTTSRAAVKSSPWTHDDERTEEPPSYSSSFNPFPALVIGVTGAAMAAHAQTYLFQVQIHALWGNLLLGFSVLRCLTYFFLWLGPPRSILPSRPPTEALASFFLACGGLTFIFSTEEVTLAAMRRGRDDVMMFLNVAVAITCFAFCWTLSVVAFKGWLKSRSQTAPRSYP